MPGGMGIKHINAAADQSCNGVAIWSTASGRVIIEKQFIIEFIRLYRSLPALWDTSTKEYFNRVVKNNQYSVLLEKYREKFPKAGKEEVKKKINSLRTKFRHELRRYAEAGDEEIPSKCWYYGELAFLKNLESPFKTTRANIPKPAYEFLYECEPTLCEENVMLDRDDTAVSAKTNLQISLIPPLKQIKVEEDFEEPVEPPSKRHHYHPDEFDTIAAAWAVELRKMEPSQQMFAKKAIYDILFEGQMGTLHRDSVVINQNNN